MPENDVGNETRAAQIIEPVIPSLTAPSREESVGKVAHNNSVLDSAAAQSELKKDPEQVDSPAYSSDDDEDPGSTPSTPESPLFPGLAAFLRGESFPSSTAALSGPQTEDDGHYYDGSVLAPTESITVPEQPVIPGSEKKRRLDELLPIDRSAEALKKLLDEYVIGQERAKQDIAVLFSMHLRWFDTADVLHRAPNALLIGPTGVGKTHALKTAATYLHLPFVVVDATGLVPAGALKGQQAEDVLTELVITAAEMLRDSDVDRFENDDILLAERGVIFLDEFDKLADNLGDPGNIGAWNRTTQRRLLKFTEGTTMVVETVLDGNITRRAIDTSGILFVAGGAFAGIDSLDIRAARGDRVNRALRPGNEVIAQDVVSYGFIAELVARLQIMVHFEELTPLILLDILRNPRISPFGVWRNHFRQIGKEVDVTTDAEVEIAKRAAALEMGARGLQQIIFPALARRVLEFESGSDRTLIIDKAMISGTEPRRN